VRTNEKGNAYPALIGNDVTFFTENGRYSIMKGGIRQLCSAIHVLNETQIYSYIIPQNKLAHHTIIQVTAQKTGGKDMYERTPSKYEREFFADLLSEAYQHAAPEYRKVAMRALAAKSESGDDLSEAFWNAYADDQDAALLMLDIKLFPHIEDPEQLTAAFSVDMSELIVYRGGDDNHDDEE